MATGNANESLLALVNGKWVNLRVPYPMGFYAKWMDGRIDDPNGGWKGRGLWSTFGNRTPFHVEGGKGTPPKVVQLPVAARSAGAVSASALQTANARRRIGRAGRFANLSFAGKGKDVTRQDDRNGTNPP